ncbi:GNAT family N-acetyltransferase [Clostridium nigeriense]|uniref:GNAT family N-acetyltransferase n=1 Tax=Clostridium nigeriense TaxID=1805470 RepID=UPI003D35927B
MELFIKRFDELSTEELYEILKIRVNVFVVEQECAYQEIDEKDKKAYHIYLKDKNEIKAYLRVLDKGISYEEVSIGRVLTTERGIGLGNKIIEAGIKVAKENMNADKIKIEAQSYAKKFYEKFGFNQISDEFLEDGIPHIEMILE